MDIVPKGGHVSGVTIVVHHPHVSTDPEILGGAPHVVGSRVPVHRILGFYENGCTVEKIVARFPRLGPAKVFDALSFACDNRKLVEHWMEIERRRLSAASRVAG